MGKFFFSGSTSAKLDEKGRFVLPQQMRFGLVEEGALEFSLALGLGGCLSDLSTERYPEDRRKVSGEAASGEVPKIFHTVLLDAAPDDLR